MKKFLKRLLVLMLLAAMITANLGAGTVYAEEDSTESLESEVETEAAAETAAALMTTDNGNSSTDGTGTDVIDTGEAGTEGSGTDDSGTAITSAAEPSDEESGTEDSAAEESGAEEQSLTAPNISKAVGYADYVSVVWKAVGGASSYELERSTDNNTWTEIKNASKSCVESNGSVTYTDSDVKSGKTYYYRVKAVSGSTDIKDSGYSAEARISFVGTAPTVTASCAEKGAKISWNKVNYATGYQVFYKSADSSGKWSDWTKTGGIQSKSSTSYTYTGAKSGTKYKFTVRCVDADTGNYSGGYQSSSALTYVAAPSLVSVVGAASGVTVTWKKSTGAGKYRVFRKVSGGTWKRLADVSTLTYTDKTAVTGTNYIYTVRCIDSSGNYISYYQKDGLPLNYRATPKLKSVTGSSKGVTVTWSAVTGGSGYKVFYKSSATSNKWKALGTTTDTTYTDKTAKTGSATIYTVRCVDSTTGSYASGYDASGLSITYVKTPELTKIQGTNSGPKLTWSKVSGAVTYRVYRKASGAASWSKLANVAATSASEYSYTDKTASAGKTYTYTVRCVDSKGTQFTSGYDAEGLSIAYVATPELEKLEAGADNIKITWGSVKGAKGYRVFRKTGSSTSWKKVADVESTGDSTLTYTDTSVTIGTKYIYTVRCIDSATSMKVYTSGYDSTGLKVTFVDAPKLVSAANAATGVKVSWNAVSGAEKYRVFRKTDGSSWKKVGDVASGTTSYTDTTASSGTTYIYTVRCITSAGYYAGTYDKTGLTVTYLAAPKISGVSYVSATSAKVTWGKVTGAVKYRVFYKTSGSSSWVRVGDTTSTSYEVTGLSTGTYTFTVRCVDSTGSSYTSGYDSTGFLYVSGNSMDAKAQSYSSTSKYLILVDCTNNKVGVYTGSKGNWTRKYYWSCCTGTTSRPTPKGTFTVGDKGLSMGTEYTAWYWTQFKSLNRFHSVLYKPGSKTKLHNGTLGQSISHGCVRLALTNAKWIYDNVPRGTTVVTYK